jgi:hypothetical protein
MAFFMALSFQILFPLVYSIRVISLCSFIFILIFLGPVVN